jgi:hypothetical protein
MIILMYSTCRYIDLMVGNSIPRANMGILTSVGWTKALGCKHLESNSFFSPVTNLPGM